MTCDTRAWGAKVMAVQTECLRDYSDPVTNSEIWERFELRPDDVIVNTLAKCGTTWMRNIVMMLFHGRAGRRQSGGRPLAGLCVP